MYYKPRHFPLYELVPRWEYQHVPHDYLWGCWNSAVLWTQEQLRVRYGKMIVNTWRWEGPTQFRGYRPPRCKQGARWSQHRFFNAIDSVPVDCTAEEIRKDIKKNPSKGIFEFITCIEAGVPWLHFDSRNYYGLLILKELKNDT